MRLLTRTLLVIMLLLFGYSKSFSQSIRLNVSSRPLGETLRYLSENSNTMLSYDQREVDKYTISIDSLFNSGGDALRYILQGLPFKIKIIKGVYVIIPSYGHLRVSGRIYDQYSGEGLPYALIVSGNKRYLTDADGHFSIPVNQTFSSLKIAYLGYVQKDTILSNLPAIVNISLLPGSTLLREAVLEAFEIENSMQSGTEPAVFKINHVVSAYLPGNGDNSVFNLMRMMPGVRATGEQGGLFVWGSKPGESALFLDGARLFSMSGYNEQISLINPFIVKDINLHKGAYGPKFGNQTGAIAEITGIAGRLDKPELMLNLNNQTLNIFSSVPISKTNNLMASYRQTFYGLFSAVSLRQNTRGDDIKIYPEYSFRDANVRFSGYVSDRANYRLSLMGSADNFSYSLNDDDAMLDASEKNRQFVGSASINLRNKLGGAFLFQAGHSILENRSLKFITTRGNNIWRYNKIKVEQNVSESYLKGIYNFGLFKNGKLTLALEGFRQYISDTTTSWEEYRASLYADQEFAFKGATLKAGIRGDYFLGRFYLQPRFSLVAELGYGFKTFAAFGLYNQFSGKVPEIYEEVAPLYIWKIFGSNTTPVVSSTHLTAGFSWSDNRLFMSLEGYYKRNNGIAQIIRSSSGASVLSGVSLFSGADLFAKWEKGGSQLFSSFTYSFASEIYSETLNYRYNPMEIKAGGVLNISPFHISTTFVYGDGYRDFFGTGRYSSVEADYYSRLDISGTYEFRIKKFKFMTGVSILNVLNTKNKKTLEVIPIQQRGQGQGSVVSPLANIYAEAIPFSPAVFIQITL